MSITRPALSLPALSLLPLFAFATLVGCSADGGSPGPTPPDGAAARTFIITLENVSEPYDYFDSGAQALPVGASSEGPLLPGDAYEVAFHAAPGHRLSFAAMFVHSNDLFYAPAETGIDLFDELGIPTSGDVTAQVMVWDAGTEANEEPGLGANQAPSQSGPNMGPADADDAVRLATDEFGNLPTVADVLQVTLTPGTDNEFVLRLENVSTDQTLVRSDASTSAVPIAPVAFVIHSEPAPLFAMGEPDRGEGLEALTEDGDPGALVLTLDARAGVASPVAPGVFAVHGAGSVLYRNGQADAGMGLESLAEDGDPEALARAVESIGSVAQSGIYSMDGATYEEGPILPGSSYLFSVQAAPGQYLSFASMFVQSNDLFVGPSDMGIALFDSSGEPIEGDITAQVMLWNAGTEVDQVPGAGPDQAPRQAAPNTGTDEGGVVRPADTGVWPAVDQVVRVSIALE